MGATSVFGSLALTLPSNTTGTTTVYYYYYLYLTLTRAIILGGVGEGPIDLHQQALQVGQAVAATTFEPGSNKQNNLPLHFKSHHEQLG